jgi:hypothetical protein
VIAGEFGNQRVVWDILLIGFVLMPATLALIWLALPLQNGRGLLLVALAFVAIAFACDAGGAEIAANFAKLGAMTFFAWWFLGFFETAAWVALVASIIPWVDIYSVFRGPTKTIVEEEPGLFEALSIFFPTMGGNAARLGLPDVLFFALFLAATVRFGLRTRLTWIGMTLSFGVTMALAHTLDVDGLPALPLLSLGFLAPNADLLWKTVRKHV